MALDSLTAKANTGTGTDSLAGVTTPQGFAGAVALVDNTGALISSANPPPLPTGAATQTTLAALETKAATAAGQTAIVTALGSPLQAGGTVNVGNFPATQSVSAASLPLPTGAATETTLATLAADIGDVADAEATGNGSVIALLKRMRTLLGSAPPAVLTSYSQAGVITINTVLTTLDCLNHRGVSIQCVSMGTAGVVTPEWSNDNTNWLPATLFTQAGASAATFNAAGLWVLPVAARYLRLRLSTATTAGTTTLSIHQFDDRAQQWLATQPISGTVTATVASTTITSGTVALAVPGIIADVASAALTTTTTTAALTPTAGTSYTVNIPVTVVSGTNPTLDVGVEESDDTGTNWFRVYDFPRITATGSYRSPPLVLRGNRVRYVQTVGGTTPSFTRAINRMQRSDDAILRVSFIDRTIVLNTLNSATPAYFVEGCSDFNFMVRCTAQSAAATITVQFSHDGANWHTTGNTLTTVNGIAHIKVQNEQWKFARLIVTAAGTSITLGEAMIIGRSG